MGGGKDVIIEKGRDVLSCASSVKNGPNTVDSVELATVGWSIASTNADTPNTSDSRMNSCRLRGREFGSGDRQMRMDVHVCAGLARCCQELDTCPICTAAVNNCIACNGRRTCIHSSVVKLPYAKPTNQSLFV